MKSYRINILIALALLFGVTFSSASSAQAALLGGGVTTPAEMENFLDEVLSEQMQEKHIPGVVVSVVKDGEVFFSKGYGYANVADQIPVDSEQTLFRIGSVSKLFAATAVMQLVEQGKLDLDADINTYLDFQIPDTFPNPITLKHLLTHTPGFEDAVTGLAVYTPEQMTFLGDYLKSHQPARVFSPGEVSAYSNYGIALAAYIVELRSGMPFADYVEKNIFKPLGMEHSTILQPLPAGLAPALANGYNYLDGSYVPGNFEFFQAYPSGAISATAEDMAKFMIAHLQNGQYGNVRILENDTAKKMHGPVYMLDSRLMETTAYGFARKYANDELTLWHNGITFLFHSGLYLLPEHNLGVFISSNGVVGTGLEKAVFDAFMDHYFPVQPDEELVPSVEMAVRARQYAGEYYAARSNFTGIEKFRNLLSPVKISVDEDGYVLFPLGGETIRFVEVEHGLLQRADDPQTQIVLKVNELGQQYLLMSNATLIKSLWYQTQAFHLSVLGFSLLIQMITLLGWAVSAIVRRVKGRLPQPGQPRLARISGVAFISLLIAFLTSLLMMLSQVEPVFELPLFFLEVPTALPIVLWLPPVMGMVGIVLLAFTVLAWRKRFWSFSGRLHYTLVTISAWLLLGELAYWNFLL